MNHTIKHTRLILAAICLFTSMLQAADSKPATYTYQGEVAGVMCSVCSGHVKAVLSKLDGVTAVKITLGKDGAPPRLEVISTSPELTKEAAIKALGDKASQYQIRSLKLVR